MTSSRDLSLEKDGFSTSQPRSALHGAGGAAERAGAFTHEDIAGELSFIISERRADINRIKRERKESDAIKAIRIGFAEKMIGRTQAARAMVRVYPMMLSALQRIAAATMASTNSGTLAEYQSWVRAVAETAIADTSPRPALPRG